jgi:predicted acyltransferase
MLAGCGALAAGYAWSFVFPINKQLWTSSYTLVAAGCSLLLLTLCYEIIEVRGWRRWSQPFATIGANAIFVYVASDIAQDALERSGTRALVFGELAAFGDPWAASLLYALGITVLWWPVLYVLHRRGLFVRV